MRSSQAQRAMTLQSSWQTRRLMSWTPHLRQFIVGLPAILLRFFCTFLRFCLQFCCISASFLLMQTFLLWFLHAISSCTLLAQFPRAVLCSVFALFLHVSELKTELCRPICCMQSVAACVVRVMVQFNCSTHWTLKGTFQMQHFDFAACTCSSLYMSAGAVLLCLVALVWLLTNVELMLHTLTAKKAQVTARW